MSTLHDIFSGDTPPIRSLGVLEGPEHHPGFHASFGPGLFQVRDRELYLVPNIDWYEFSLVAGEPGLQGAYFVRSDPAAEQYTSEVIWRGGLDLPLPATFEVITPGGRPARISYHSQDLQEASAEVGRRVRLLQEQLDLPLFGIRRYLIADRLWKSVGQLNQMFGQGHINPGKHFLEGGSHSGDGQLDSHDPKSHKRQST